MKRCRPDLGIPKGRTLPKSPTNNMLKKIRSESSHRRPTHRLHPVESNVVPASRL